MATCKECIHEKLCVIKAFPDAFENTQWDKEPCDHFLSTADFAPKSEVHDDHHKQVACYTLGCREGDKIKREVAREIFKEIETYLFYHENIPNTVYKTIDKNIFTSIKKKYTEDQNNEN